MYDIVYLNKTTSQSLFTHFEIKDNTNYRVW